MSPDVRLMLGAVLLAIGLVAPAGVWLVAETSWPMGVKSVVGGVLFFGFEIAAIPAVAIMGKENYQRILVRVKSFVGSLKPAGDVGRARHAVGILLFVLPIVPTYVMAYTPAWLPDASPARLWLNLGADGMFLAALFVLGGEFWDKLRALFVRRARGVPA